MALRYRVTKRSNSIQGKKEQYILQAVHTGKIDLDTISKAISNECSLHEVDVKAVLIALGIKLEYYLEKGNSLDLGAIGKFKMGFLISSQELVSEFQNVPDTQAVLHLPLDKSNTSFEEHFSSSNNILLSGTNDNII